MDNRIKSIVVTFTFLLIIFGLGVTQLLLPDQEITKSERRWLATIPKMTFEHI